MALVLSYTILRKKRKARSAKGNRLKGRNHSKKGKALGLKEFSSFASEGKAKRWHERGAAIKIWEGSLESGKNPSSQVKCRR